MKKQGRKESPYRMELLPEVQAFHRQARKEKEFARGQLVYYGPKPAYYGIGEIKRVMDTRVAVDFRGTGQFGVHEEIIEPQYLIRIPRSRLAVL